MAGRIEYRGPDGQTGSDLYPTVEAASAALKRTLDRYREKGATVVERPTHDGETEYLVTTLDREVFVYGISE